MVLLSKRVIKRYSELTNELNTLAKRVLVFVTILTFIVHAAKALIYALFGLLLP